MSLNRTSAGKVIASPFFVPLCLLGMTLAMFGDVLFRSGAVLSESHTDLATEFIYWRDFGFSNLRHGHVALWNPHEFSGVPYMGGWQSALFYPPNWIYLLLPLSNAINGEIVLHVFLTGLFMSLWMARYRLHPAAILLAAAMVMFGGPYFLHIYAGHLATLDAMAWIPLILLALDGLIDEVKARWVLLGVFAFSMQLLAGHPQTVFNTVVMVILYTALSLLRSFKKRNLGGSQVDPEVSPAADGPDRPALAKAGQSRKWLKVFVGLAVMGIGVVGVTAVQVFTGLQTASEGLRHGGLSYLYASSISFAPENFITLLAPNFFGNMTTIPYWGRYDLWEMCLYTGVTGLVLAIYGGFAAANSRRAVWVLMAVALLWIALGGHTPLFRFLYNYVPGFNLFRSHSKFIFEATLFGSMLAGFGLDSLLNAARPGRAAAALLLVGALAASGLGTALRSAEPSSSPSGGLGSIMSVVSSTHETHFLPGSSLDNNMIKQALEFSGVQCLIAAGLLLGLALLFHFRPRARKLCYVIALLGICEVFIFARSTVTTFDPASTIPPNAAFLVSHPGDYRIQQLAFASNSSIATNSSDLWGYDPMVTRRYAEFMAVTQDLSPDSADMYLTFHEDSPLYRMLRRRYTFLKRGDSFRVMDSFDPLPHVLLVNNWALGKGRDQILGAMSTPAFDPTKIVLLESAPDPLPVASANPGTVSLTGSTTDSLTITADVPQPSILLITDTYSRFWRAVALPGSSQQKYQLMPGDYILRAIPLAAGKHSLRVEYAPSGYTLGKWVSAVSVLAFLAFWYYIHRRAKRSAGAIERETSDAADLQPV